MKSHVIVIGTKSTQSPLDAPFIAWLNDKGHKASVDCTSDEILVNGKDSRILEPVLEATEEWKIINELYVDFEIEKMMEEEEHYINFLQDEGIL